MINDMKYSIALNNVQKCSGLIRCIHLLCKMHFLDQPNCVHRYFRLAKIEVCDILIGLDTLTCNILTVSDQNNSPLYISADIYNKQYTVAC